MNVDDTLNLIDRYINSWDMRHLSIWAVVALAVFVVGFSWDKEHNCPN